MTGKFFCRKWICPQEAAQPATFIQDDHRRLQVLDPGTNNVMHIGRVLLGVVVDQVLVLVLEVLLESFIWPDSLKKNLNLQRKIQKTVFQAECTERVYG